MWVKKTATGDSAERYDHVGVGVNNNMESVVNVRHVRPVYVGHVRPVYVWPRAAC